MAIHRDANPVYLSANDKITIQLKLDQSLIPTLRSIAIGIDIIINNISDINLMNVTHSCTAVFLNGNINASLDYYST